MLDVTAADSEQMCREIGSRLRAHRLGQLVTQAELARRAGVSTGTVQNIEAGHTSLDSLIRVAFALGMTPDFREFFAQRLAPIAQMEHVEPTKRIRAPRRGTRPKVEPERL